jgi:zinc D-Ala-D-Ala carboxypeptidase
VRRRRRDAARAAALALTLLVALAVFAKVAHHPHAVAASADQGTRTPPRPPATAPYKPAFTSHGARRRSGISLDLSARSTADPSSIWVVVNKTHPIHPREFRPELAIVRGYQVARAAAEPLARLLHAGDAAGLGFKIASAFRSYAYQVHVHDALVSSVGSAAADRVSARPGYSEHQTGLAVDLITPAHAGCDLTPCFAATPAGRWLARNAVRYGFIVRYTPGNQAITGYRPEPWHIRYVGRPLAAAMRAAGITTLEQALHIAGGNYR